MIAPAAAQSFLSTAAGVVPAAAPPRKSSAATTVRDAIAVADAVLGVAKKAGALVDAAAAKDADRAKASAAGYAQSGSGASKTASSKSASTKKTTSSKAKSSTAKKPAASKTAASSGPLSFLADPKLSIEEKLMRLLAHLNERWEKDLQAKMDELAGGQSAAKTPAAAKAPSSKKKGLLGNVGKIADVAKKFFPQVGIALDALQSPAVRAVVAKIGGPVLAAAASALGFPALAPALLTLGPNVIDLAAGVASAFVDQAPAAGGSSSGGGATSGGAGSASGGAMSDRQMQVKLMEMQRIMEQQKEMFSLVSNILRSGHDARMAVIQNVR